MRSRLLMIALVASAVLSTLVVVAVAQEWWVFAAVGVVAMLSCALMLAAEASRQVRAVRRSVHKLARAVAARPSPPPTPAAPPPVKPLPAKVTVQEGDQDILGAVRVLQAQYVGRLDALQSTVDEAVAALQEAARWAKTADGPAVEDGERSGRRADAATAGEPDVAP